MLDVPGLYQVRRGEIGCLTIHTKNDDGTISVTTLYKPTRDELIEEFRAHGFPEDYCLEFIDKRNSDVHTIFIETEAFVQHLRENGFL